MRILMPSIVDPATSRSGAGTVTRNFVRMLQAPPLHASVECLSIPRSVHGAHRTRQAIAIARSLISSIPAKAAYTLSPAYKERVLTAVSRGAVDLLVINGSDLLWLGPLLPATIPRLLISHNIEASLFASQAERVARFLPLLRPILARELRRMEEFETTGMRTTENVVFISSVDQTHALNATGSLRSLVVPPIFGDVSERNGTRPISNQLELGFLGNLHWWPNRDALRWFTESVLPGVQRPLQLHVFGEGRLRTGDRRVILHGPIDDLNRVWERCDLMVVPTHSGGGVSIKLAEALYHGMPVLTTRFATRGLPIAEDPALIICDEVAEWAQYLNTVAVDDLRCLRVAPAISEGFTLEAHRERLQEFVRGIVGSRPA